MCSTIYVLKASTNPTYLFEMEADGSDVFLADAVEELVGPAVFLADAVEELVGPAVFLADAVEELVGPAVFLAAAPVKLFCPAVFHLVVVVCAESVVLVGVLVKFLYVVAVIHLPLNI